MRVLILTLVFRLDQEVTFIYPAPWNAVKATYLFCRYYPLAIAPFHFWGFIGNHEQRVCESYYPALYACTIPTTLSAQFILMLRTYAFSGRKKKVLAALSITFPRSFWRYYLGDEQTINSSVPKTSFIKVHP
ncbi:hypothetical protein BJY52DRAFT_587924 [Lactarius psammicola]|nr:hypothetical protein BJY52DRAFT_587924 [Lactarius psammicola]